MSFSFVILFFIICVVADTIIIHKGLFNKYRPDLQWGLIWSILSIPTVLLVYKLDNYYKPLQDVFFVIKLMVIVVSIVLIDTVIYLLIRKSKV